MKQRGKARVVLVGLVSMLLVSRGAEGGVQGVVGPGGVAATAGLQRVSLAPLDSAEIDALFALDAVQAWLEFGDQALLVGAEPLARALDAFEPALVWETLPGAPNALRVWRLDPPAALEQLRSGAEVLLGFGRCAVVLPTPGLALGLQRDTRDGDAPSVLEPVPWNTALVSRADRVASTAAWTATSPILEAAAQAVDLDAYGSVVEALVAFGTRNSNSPSFPDVTAYVQQRFEGLGYAVTLDPFQLSGNTRHNVIAELPGTLTPDDVYIVCGHYDSTSGSPLTFAPGADDNASGAAAVIEMARVLRQYRFDSTIRFIAFAGEEQGLVGSSTYVSDLIAAGELGNVRGVINMDMIGYLNTPVWDVLLEGKAGSSQPLLALLAGLVPRYTSLTGFVSTNPYGSDHVPFINQGVNAVLTIEYEDWFNPNYHSTSDTVATLSLPFAVEIVKLNVVAVASMAGVKGGYMLEYGAGLAGAGGFAPACSGAGSANLGELARLRLEQGLGGAPGLLLLGVGAAGLPKFGGNILVDPSGALLGPVVLGGPVGAPGAGGWQLDTVVPTDPGLSGLSLYAQFVLWDAAAPKGHTLSNGLQFVFGS